MPDKTIDHHIDFPVARILHEPVQHPDIHFPVQALAAMEGVRKTVKGKNLFIPEYKLFSQWLAVKLPRTAPACMCDFVGPVVRKSITLVCPGFDTPVNYRDIFIASSLGQLLLHPRKIIRVADHPESIALYWLFRVIASL
jgi:hypothetical protein